jgi:hypothetical protein
VPCSADLSVKGSVVRVRPSAHDAFKVFHDLCVMSEGGQPKFIKMLLMSQASGLELIESVLASHGSILASHPELLDLVQTQLMPFVIRIIAEKSPFALTVRAMRILQHVLKQYLPLLATDCETALGLLNELLDPDMAALWKRTLSMEILKSIFAEPILVIQIYSMFDEMEGKKPIVKEILGLFVRLSTEKPAAIGLGNHSTVPMQQLSSSNATAEQAAMEGVTGIITSPVTSTVATGISQWSAMRTALLDYVDKSDPPPVPETYLYSLVLTCITQLSDGLARFILPLTLHAEGKARKKGKIQDPSNNENMESPPNDSSTSEGASRNRLHRSQSYKKKNVPTNPLTLESHKSFGAIKSTASLINECWPAVLATCSTFANAALDTEYYRSLIRSIQKFTQVAGLLRLDTPRDAFLTTLGKTAVPAQVLTANLSSQKNNASESTVYSNSKGLLSVDSLASQSPSLSFDKGRRSSIDTPSNLNSRNLLCLRALLNLAIALGPTLGHSWSIIFETLQQADIILALTTNRAGSRETRTGNTISQLDTEGNMPDLGSEVTAVQAAASRLFESTVDFPNDAFLLALNALCGLLHDVPASSDPKTPPLPGERPLRQRRIGSVSGLNFNTESDSRDYIVALGKIGDIAVLNLNRLAQYEASESGWSKLVEELIAVSSNTSVGAPARRMAADILGQIGKDMAKLSMEEDVEIRDGIQNTVLAGFQRATASIYRFIDEDDGVDPVTVDIHEIILDALKAVLEYCGESITAGWPAVFSILASVFRPQEINTVQEREDEDDDGTLRSNGASKRHNYPTSQARAISRRLVRSAFGSVQLICSDFLSAIPLKGISTLLLLLFQFAGQNQDLNISLSVSL